MRQSLWPRRGWRRTIKYYWRRLQRLPDSPTAIARGFAIGTAIGVTPFVGLHVIPAVVLAWLMRANVIAAGIGTFFLGNYLTILPLQALNYEIGSYLLRWMAIELAEPGAHVTMTYLAEHPMQFTGELISNPLAVLPLFLPIILGSAVVGGIAYLLVLALVRDSIHNWRERRRHMLKARRQGQ
jgi:uncharacterized protein (DUF2062 family)